MSDSAVELLTRYTSPEVDPVPVSPQAGCKCGTKAGAGAPECLCGSDAGGGGARGPVQD